MLNYRPFVLPKSGASVAQLVEQFIRNERVTSSSLVAGSNFADDGEVLTSGTWCFPSRLIEESLLADNWGGFGIDIHSGGDRLRP